MDKPKTEPEPMAIDPARLQVSRWRLREEEGLWLRARGGRVPSGVPGHSDRNGTNLPDGAGRSRKGPGILPGGLRETPCIRSLCAAPGGDFDGSRSRSGGSGLVAGGIGRSRSGYLPRAVCVDDGVCEGTAGRVESAGTNDSNQAVVPVDRVIHRANKVGGKALGDSAMKVE